MKNSNWIWGVLFVAVIVGIVFSFMSGEKEKHNWGHTLAKAEREPYDLLVFYKTLKHTFGSKYKESGIADSAGAVTKELTKIDPEGVYFFAGNSAYFSDKDSRAIAHFVSDGGTAFLLTEKIPDNFFTQIEGNVYLDIATIFLDSMSTSFSHPSLDKKPYSFNQWIRNKKVSGEWHFITEKQRDINGETDGTASRGWKKYAIYSEYITLSKVEKVGPDFIKIPHGKGNIFLHVNPILFGNFYMKTPLGRDYAAAVIQHIPNKTLFVHLGAGYPRPETQVGISDKSVYSFIQQNAPLRYAWWLLCGGMLLFLLTGGRRKQRSIPVLAAPSNSTLALVESIGYFYFREKNHALVYRREWNQFQNFARLHFRIAIDMEVDTWQKLAEKAGVKTETAMTLYVKHRDVGSFSELSATELIACNNAFTQFYTEYYKTHGK